MMTVWSLVGIVLLTFGTIITFTGIWFIFKPETKTVLSSLNPNLWWGLIMLSSGLILIAIGRVK